MGGGGGGGREERGTPRKKRSQGQGQVRGWRSNKELLRYDRQTATTWPHYGRFSPAERLSFHRRLSFPPLLSFPWFPWTSASRVMPFSPYRALPVRNLPDSSICNVRKPARYAILVRPFYVEQKILPNLVYFSGRAEQAAVGQVDPVNTRYSTIPRYGNRYDYEQISWMLWYLWTCMQNFL